MIRKLAGAQAVCIPGQEHTHTVVLQESLGITRKPNRPSRTPGASSTPKHVGLSAGGDYSTSLISLVPRGGIEPPTLRFSVACSTN